MRKIALARGWGGAPAPGYKIGACMEPPPKTPQGKGKAAAKTVHASLSGMWVYEFATQRWAQANTSQPFSTCVDFREDLSHCIDDVKLVEQYSQWFEKEDMPAAKAVASKALILDLIHPCACAVLGACALL